MGVSEGFEQGQPSGSFAAVNGTELELEQCQLEAIGTESELDADGAATRLDVNATESDGDTGRMLRLRLLGSRRHRAKFAAGALGLAVLAVCACSGTLRRGPSRSRGSSNLNKAVGLNTVDSMLDVLGTLADSVKQTAELSDNIAASYHNVTGMYHEMYNTTNKMGGLASELKEKGEKLFYSQADIREKIRSLNATQKAALKAHIMRKFNITSFKQLRPTANMHDGNQCADDEELHGDLCYKKCSQLTNGEAPVRISAWSCCTTSAPCISGLKTQFKLCGGYGVSGDSSGNGCPHSPGACLTNEELYQNRCYKRCSFLTFNQLPHRAAAATCCRSRTTLGALEFDNCNTDHRYNTGGGDSDDDVSTPAEPHPPLPELVEAGA